MVLGQDGTNAGIEEQNEQQKELITGEFWTPIEDLNTPADARELLSGDGTNLYSQDGDEVGDPQQYVDDAVETLSDPELNSNLEPQQDNDPDDYEDSSPENSGSSDDSDSEDSGPVTIDLSGLQDLVGSSDGGSSDPTTPSPSPSGGGSNQMLLLGAAAVVAAAAVFAVK